MTSHLSRRQFVGRGGLGMAAILLGTGALPTERSYASARLARDPYALGVASGDPRHDGVVLWTRLAPDPLAEDGLGGMPRQPVRVRWEVAHDEHFRHVARRGQVTALPELAYSVHPEVHGLHPGREYFYRFEAAGYVSPVGRTRTAPGRWGRTDRVSLGLVGCQNYNAGFYTAYRYLAQEDVDFVLHTGDYIYEGGFPNGARGTSVPAHMAVETVELERYRTQYGLYKSDPDLRAAHAAHAFVVYWDDHEVENNYADLIPQSAADAPTFAHRRAAAYQAYYEHQPLRWPQRARGSNLQLYRRLEWGDLLGLNVLDGRQYRSDQVAPERYGEPSRTLLGYEQERWLDRQLRTSRTRWNVLGNQGVMSWLDTDLGPGVTQSEDNWNGYHAARDRLLHGTAQAGVENLIVLTGDAHCAMASSMRADVERFEDSPVVAAEFLGTSISSGGDSQPMTARGRGWLANNPDMTFFDSRRGSSTIAMTAAELTTTYKALDFVSRPDAPLQTIAAVTVLDGVPGVQGGRIVAG